MTSEGTVSSFEQALMAIHDQCLMEGMSSDQDMQDAETYTEPCMYQETSSAQIITDPSRGINRKLLSSASISLSSEGTEFPQILDQIRMEGDNAPLPQLRISSGDFNVDSQPAHQMPVMSPDSGHLGAADNPSSMNPVMEPSPTIHRPETNDVAPSRNDDSSASRINAAADPSNGLPSACKMKLMVSYLSSKHTIEKEYDVSLPGGILLFHEKVPRDIPQGYHFIRFPPLPQAEKANDDLSLNPKEKKNIRNILENMQGGLQIRCHQGCIYATRRSKAKIFYTSVETGVDTSLELPRCQETMIFNGVSYSKTLMHGYLHVIESSPALAANESNRQFAHHMNPTIYFTFAQKWCPGTVPLNKTLVWAKLTPSLARELWDGLCHPSANNLASVNSYSGLIQISAVDSDELNKVEIMEQ